MQIRWFLLCFLLWASVSRGAFAYNAAGHKLVASICFRQMNTSQRQSIVDLLKKHPRYADDFANLMPSNIKNGPTEDQQLWLFQQAAVWPDMAKSGPVARRAFNRQRWHYVNRPHFLTQEDKEELEGNVDVNLNFNPPPSNFDDSTMNVVAAIRNSERIFRSTTQLDAQRALHICWLLHNIGDIHQPLHSTALFSRHLFPQGDRGGNQVATQQHSNLHSAWDAAVGTNDNFTTAKNRAIELASEAGYANTVATAITSLDPEQWSSESFEICKVHAYSHEINLQLESLEENQDDIDHNRVNLSEDYLRNRKAVGDRLVVMAGARVAAVLIGTSSPPSPNPTGAAALRVGVQGTSPADDRMKVLEAKLDRIIELLEARGAK